MTSQQHDQKTESSKHDRQAALDIPSWDGVCLRFRGEIVKRYQKNAGNQFIILNAFEEAGWPSLLAAPQAFLETAQTRRQLRETIDGLNRRQNAIAFRKRNCFVIWEPRQTSRVPTPSCGCTGAAPAHSSASHAKMLVLGHNATLPESSRLRDPGL